MLSGTGHWPIVVGVVATLVASLHFLAALLGVATALVAINAGAATRWALQARQPGYRNLPNPGSPEPVRSGESLEPDIRIIRGEDKIITEYRINGQVRAVKVEPDNAPVYYLVDYDGDGDFEVSDSFEPGYVTQWILFSW